MNLQIFKMLNFVQRYARILCSKAAVRVTFGGTTASRCGDHIRLPSFAAVLSDLALARSLFVGFIVHESCHVLWTDSDVWATYVREKGTVRQSMVNILEDVRIERKMYGYLQGTKTSLIELVKRLVAMDFFGMPSQTTGVLDLIHMHTLYSLRAGVLEQTALLPLADSVKGLLTDAIGSQNIARIDGVIGKVVDTQTTADVTVVVDELFDLLAEIEQQTQPPKPQDQASDDQDQNTDPSADDADDSQQGQGSTDRDQNTDPSAENQQGSGSDADDQNTDPSADDADDSQQGQGSTDQDPNANPQGNVSGGAGSAGSWILGAADQSQDSSAWDIGALVASAINEDADDSKSELSYMDIDFPVVFGSRPFERAPHGRHVAALKKAKTASNSLAFQLHALVEAQTDCSRSRRDQGVRVSRGQLHRVAAGDFRVFEKKRRSEGVKTAVMVVEDVSPSMMVRSKDGRRRIDVALESVLALSLALESISDVQVGVMAYPHAERKDEDTIEQYMIDLVEFGESVAPRSEAIMNVRCTGTTPTAEAVLYASGRLDELDVDRRVILVITDGESDNPERLADVCKSVGQDTDIIAIGIGTDAVKREFDRAIVIDDVSDLAGVAFREMRQVLLAA